MPTRLLDRPATPSALSALPPARPARVPDVGYEARARLTRLQAVLATASTARSPNRWKEPPLFFFDSRREAERATTCSPSPTDAFQDVSRRIAAELPSLCASVEVRRVARAVAGLQTVADSLAPFCAAAKDLADLLAVPDDEVILALHPARRLGFRLTVRGVVDVGQFHVLMAAAIMGDSDPGFLPGPSMPDRFVSAYRNTGPSSPAGVPMLVEARFQLYVPAALRADGTLPTGFAGCEHWLWPTSALATIPRMGGERVVLLGPPAYGAKWEVVPRFPGMLADVQLVEALGPFLAAERLTQLTGQAIAPVQRIEQERVLSKAA